MKALQWRQQGELKAVSVQENLPPYAGYIDAEVPGGTILLRQQAADYYRDLQARAQQAAEREGVNLTTELVEGATKWRRL